MNLIIKMKNYILITPARNESAYIPKVISCVSKQTVLPIKWVIVSDGSTDDMDDIVERASLKNPFIHLIRVEGRSNRSFGSKALAFNEGYKEIKGLKFDYIGNLDADVTFQSNYYEKIIEKMANNTLLGIASGVLFDKTDYGFKRTISNLNHAVGAVQFWRRECFEDVGGYRPVTVGGIDSIAELTARMKGWETRSFVGLQIYHHKSVDFASGQTVTMINYRAGMTEYHIGTHPLFAFFKAFRRWQKSPMIFSTFIRLFGYFRLWIAGTRRDATDELLSYLKREQMARLKFALRRRSIQ